MRPHYAMLLLSTTPKFNVLNTCGIHPFCAVLDRITNTVNILRYMRQRQKDFLVSTNVQQRHH